MTSWRRRTSELARLDERDLQRLALHEAAHALVAFVCGLRIKSVWVNSFRGYCDWEPSNDHRSIVTVAIAGPSADYIFWNKSRAIDSQDYRDARFRATRVADTEGGEIEDIIARARAEAETLVQRHAAVIKTLAAALMRARELPGEQVEDILRRAGVQRSRASQPGRNKRIIPIGNNTPVGREMYLERRNGHNVPVERREPDRIAFAVLRRIDGYIA